MQSPKAILPKELALLLSSRTPPLVIDLRKDADYTSDPRLLPGAVKRNIAEIDSWGMTLPRDRSIVVYCQQGKSVGTAAVEVLRNQGLVARQIEGGFSAWREAGLPLGGTQS